MNIAANTPEKTLSRTNRVFLLFSQALQLIYFAAAIPDTKSAADGTAAAIRERFSHEVRTTHKRQAAPVVRNGCRQRNFIIRIRNASLHSVFIISLPHKKVNAKSMHNQCIMHNA